MQPGMSVSYVAASPRSFSMRPRIRKAVQADEDVVGASRVRRHVRAGPPVSLTKPMA